MTADPPWGTEVIAVHTTHPTTLVRDVTFATGWQAQITPANGAAGRSVAAVVVRHGLVQAVSVPAGDPVVTFRYRPHRVEEGLALGAVGMVAALALVALGLRRGRPRRTAAANRR